MYLLSVEQVDGVSMELMISIGGPILLHPMRAKEATSMLKSTALKTLEAKATQLAKVDGDSDD